MSRAEEQRVVDAGPGFQGRAFDGSPEQRASFEVVPGSCRPIVSTTEARFNVFSLDGVKTRDRLGTGLLCLLYEVSRKNAADLLGMHFCVNCGSTSLFCSKSLEKCSPYFSMILSPAPLTSFVLIRPILGRNPTRSLKLAQDSKFMSSGRLEPARPGGWSLAPRDTGRPYKWCDLPSWESDPDGA